METNKQQQIEQTQLTITVNKCKHKCEKCKKTCKHICEMCNNM